MDTICVLVQVFNKVDTLSALWSSLRRRFDLSNIDMIIWQDSPLGSRKEADYLEKASAVEAFVHENILTESARFRSMNFIKNQKNEGTCKTCQLSLDYAFSKFDKVIFAEDDTIFSYNSIEWFQSALATQDFSSNDIWAVAGESVFFDSRSNALPDSYKTQALAFAVSEELDNKFILHNFMPSTCFATTAAKWSEFRATRGLPTGADELCKRCISEKKYCLFPIVPRVMDVGMQHPDGYSVLMLTPKGVRENKSTYLTMDDLPQSLTARPLSKFRGHDGELWRRTVLLEGFGTLPPWQQR